MPLRAVVLPAACALHPPPPRNFPRSPPSVPCIPPTPRSLLLATADVRSEGIAFLLDALPPALVGLQYELTESMAACKGAQVPAARADLREVAQLNGQLAELLGSVPHATLKSFAAFKGGGRKGGDRARGRCRVVLKCPCSLMACCLDTPLHTCCLAHMPILVHTVCPPTDARTCTPTHSPTPPPLTTFLLASTGLRHKGCPPGGHDAAHGGRPGCGGGGLLRPP